MSEPAPFPRVCVIGAGPRGIAACRTLSESGIAFDCFEKRESVAASLFHTGDLEIGGGPGSRADADACPQACVIAEALESYVTRFGFRPKIAFGRAVEYVLQLPDGRWRVHAERSPAGLYDALFVAATDRHPLPAHTQSDRMAPKNLPFFDPVQRTALQDDLPLWKHLIHPRYGNLFFLSRLPTARLTLRIAEEQVRLAAGFIRGRYRLPTRWQMESERRAIPHASAHASDESGPESRDCPESACDTRYAFHLRSQLVKRMREFDGEAPQRSRKPGARETAGS